MEAERMQQAVARIETALARIEQAAGAPTRNASDGDARIRQKVDRALTELDALIGRLER